MTEAPKEIGLYEALDASLDYHHGFDIAVEQA